MSSIFNSPNPLYFGLGVSKETGEKLKGLGVTKVLAVYDKGIKAAGIVDKILDYVKAAGIEIVHYDKVEANPPDYSCDEAGALAVKEGVDGILGIGGGSSMDTAKAARVLTAYPGPINQYFAKLDTPPLDESNMKPLVVIPTTAGTGSEASPGAVISDSKTHAKYPVNCSINLGIIDPELMTGLPAGITVSTAVDALCHAAESVTSRLHNRFSDVIALEAIRLIAKSLPVAVKEPGNIEARSDLALAASLGTMSMKGPFGGIPHALGSPIGTVYPVPHGTACGCLLAESFVFVAPALPEQVKKVAEALGAKVPANAAPEEIGTITRDAVYALYKEVKFPSMKSFISSKDDMLSKIDTLYRPCVFSPREFKKEDAIVMLSNAYDNY